MQPWSATALQQCRGHFPQCGCTRAGISPGMLCSGIGTRVAAPRTEQQSRWVKGGGSPVGGHLFVLTAVSVRQRKRIRTMRSISACELRGSRPPRSLEAGLLLRRIRQVPMLTAVRDGSSIEDDLRTRASPRNTKIHHPGRIQVIGCGFDRRC